MANSVEKVEAVLQSLKTQAKAAHEEKAYDRRDTYLRQEKDVFLLGVLTELIGVCSPIVNRALARQMREERAKINKAHAALRKEVREQAPEPSDI